MKRYVLVILFLVDLLSIGFYMHIYFGHIFINTAVAFSCQRSKLQVRGIMFPSSNSQSNTSAIKPLLGYLQWLSLSFSANLFLKRYQTCMRSRRRL